MREKPFDELAKIISYLLPNRVIYWAIIRAFAYTSVHSQPDKTPDEINFTMVADSWDYKTRHSLNNYAEVKWFMKYK